MTQPQDTAKREPNDELRKQLTTLLDEEQICRCGRNYKSPNFAYHVCPENGLRTKILKLIAQYGDQRELQGRKNITKNLKRWINSRLANYGRNDTINALQERISELEAKLKAKESE